MHRVYAKKKGEGLAETGNATGSLAIIVSVVQDDSQLGLLANASIMYITYGSGSLTAHCCSLISKFKAIDHHLSRHVIWFGKNFHVHLPTATRSKISIRKLLWCHISELRATRGISEHC
jgi:hypothetical protein